MKTSKIIITILFLTLAFSACTTFQFTSLNSNLLNLDSNYFLYQDDTLEVKYSFAGQNCPLHLTIFNKTDETIFINWNESAVIINGNSLPINPLSSLLSGTTSSYSLANNYETSNGTLSGVIQHSDQTGFIPPKASISIDSYNLSNGFINTLATDSTRKVYDEGALANVTKHFFNKENSPLKINCFLTYSNNKKTEKNQINSEFWCASVYKTNYKSSSNRGDQYYVSRSSVAGSIIGTVAVVGITIVTTMVEIEEEKSYDD